MGYFKEFMKYTTPFFSEMGFELTKGTQFVHEGTPFTNVFEFVSYSAGSSFKVVFGVRNLAFNKIFNEIVGWKLHGDYVLSVTSENSFLKILKYSFDVDSKSQFPERLKDVEEAFNTLAVQFYKKNNSLLAVRNNLRENEIFRPMIGNTDFYLVEWKTGIYLDLLITKLLEPEKFDDAVEHYRLKCATKRSRGYGENPDEIVDYESTFTEVQNEFLPKLENRNWDAYRKKIIK